MASDDRDIDWESVRYFLRAAESKSLSGAARALGVEHTTVGRRLAGLERAVGASLVERGPSGLALTPLGERVLELAAAMDASARAIAELGSAERTNVRLVVPTGFTALLTPHLEALRRAQPGVSLEIVSSGRRVDLRKGEADLAIRVGPIDDEALIARKITDVGSALYASRAYLARTREPVDPDDLGTHAVIGFHRSLSAMPAAEWLAARSPRATIVMRSREAVDMLTAARSGAGLAVLPCFLGDAEPSLERLTREPIGVRRVSLIYRREARLSPELRAVIAFVLDVLREHTPSLRGRA
jgi:DNA-binding transcriptional LysR family regulator